MGSGRLVMSGGSLEIDGCGSDVPSQFVCNSGSGGGSFVLALNHICDL